LLIDTGPVLDVGRSLRYFLLNVVGDLLRRRVPGPGLPGQ